MKVDIVSSPLFQQKADAWLIFTLGSEPILPSPENPISRRLGRMLKNWMRTSGYRGKPHAVSIFPSWETLPARCVILAGLGDRSEFHIGRLFHAAAAVAKATLKPDIRILAVSADPTCRALGISEESLAQALVIGLQHGCYEFSRFITQPRHGKAADWKLILTGLSRSKTAVRRMASESLAVGGIVTEIRTLANLPGNEATPLMIARTARSLARKYRLQCTIWNRRELERKRCQALLAAAQGSDQEACMIILKYRGTNPRLRPLALVGKTITFDAGGISLKPPKSMEWMKYDKCGGLAVLATLLIAARLKFRHPVIGILAAAENMPGGSATRPGDIVRARSGKTIEIVNTDAEGRMALADALTVAGEFKPEAIIDLATLTGACIVALGHILSAVMGNHKKLVDQLVAAGETSGERLWPFPLLPEYRNDIRGQFSDLKNVGEHGAGAIIGGSFLNYFIPKNVPWAHIDIAGTAWEEKDRSFSTAGATLFGARLLVEWIKNLENRKT